MNTPLAPTPHAPLSKGEIVGNYQIQAPLGEGGMGAVYLATHLHMKSHAVVKVLHPHLSSHPDISTRFVNEARAASALKHRNIVAVHDCGQRANGQWFIAMEYLDGSPLSRLLQTTGGPSEPSTIVLIIGQAANGLHVAHEAGFVHRDIKPDNLFLTQTTTNDHHLTILDFGIAKLDEAHGGGHTHTNALIGTPTYMAPEQLRASKDVDRRADVYSLGVVAWEMAAGRRLWGDLTSPGAIMEQQVTNARPLDPCVIEPRLPGAIGVVIAKALAPRPEDRWQTAQAFALALAHALPRSEWAENGIEILRSFANELTIAEVNAETAGRPVRPAVSHVGAPTVRAIAVGAAPSPVPPLTPAGIPAGRGPEIATVPLGPYGPNAVPIMPQPPPAATVGQPTTLGGATGQSMHTPMPQPAPAGRRGRRGLMLAAAGAAVIGLVAVAIVAGTDDGARITWGGPAPAVDDAAPSKPATSAVAIVTEPSGAMVTVDGVSKGPAPLNVAAPVGAEIEVRAELLGHAPAVERVRVTAEPGTVRLGLVPFADAAVDAPPAPVDAGIRRVRPRPPQGGSDFDPDSVVQP